MIVIVVETPKLVLILISTILHCTDPHLTYDRERSLLVIVIGCITYNYNNIIIIIIIHV